MERKVLNAERIVNEGIKPENLRCSERSRSGKDFLFDIYDDATNMFIGDLRIVNGGAIFAGKIFKPVELWLCCDEPIATYKSIPRIFISQPMDGRSEEDILKEREEIINMLENKYDKYGDIFIIDNYIKNSLPGANGLWYLSKSIELLSTADIAYFARGWECARECTIEFLCARKYGIQIIEAEKDHCYPADILNSEALFFYILKMEESKHGKRKKNNSR